MADRGYTTPENLRIILDVVKYLRANGFVIDAGRSNSQFIPPQSPIGIRNDSGVEIPAFGCVQCTGTVEASGNNWIKVVKPVDTTGASGGYLFNGIAPVEIGGYGIAHDGPECRMLTDGTTITSGAGWRPSVAAFTIVPGGSTFTAIGADDIGTDVMRGLIQSAGGTALYKATMNEAWTAGVAECSIFSIDGVTFTDTAIDADVYDGLLIFTSLTTGDDMYVLLQGGKYYAIQAPCP